MGTVWSMRSTDDVREWGYNLIKSKIRFPNVRKNAVLVHDMIMYVGSLLELYGIAFTA